MIADGPIRVSELDNAIDWLLGVLSGRLGELRQGYEQPSNIYRGRLAAWDEIEMHEIDQRPLEIALSLSSGSLY
jgi:hypothetical protein